MKQIRISKRHRPGSWRLEPQPADLRDHDIVRAKQLARRSRPPGDASAYWTACWRIVCRVAAMLRDLHREQVYAAECICRASRALVDRAGPLTWIPSLDGPRLVGTWLPGPDAAASPDR